MRSQLDVISLSGDRAAHAVEVAPRIWWVGKVLPDDPFQCHAYLIEAGDHSVLVDPGSSLTIRDTMRKVQEVVPLDAIASIVVHHSDPDVCDGLHVLETELHRPDVRILTEWRSALLLRHLAVRFEMVSIEDLHWHLPLGDGRDLEFALTPYLHFPGAFVTFDRSTGSLLSSDLFGGFNRANRLWATSADDFEDLRQFHEHYMPSRDIVIAGLGTIISKFSPIERVLPQHGYLIPAPLVPSMFEQLSRLECGVMLASRSDTHLALLLEVAATIRRIEDLLEESTPLDDQLRRIHDELAEVMPLAELWVETPTADGMLRIDADHPLGVELSVHSAADEHTHLIDMGSPDELPHLVVVLRTNGPFEMLTELDSLLSMLAARVRHVIGEALELRAAQERESSLRTAANTDPLTGLLNRRALDQLHGVPADAAVLMVDIDQFKSVNDTYGHHIGDAALRAVATAIRSSLRRTDRAFRYGGEEFVVLVALEPEADDEQIVALGERIRHLVEGIDTAALGLERPITVSIGIDRLDDPANLSAHIQHADTALYAAKAMGRNRVELHTCAARS